MSKLSKTFVYVAAWLLLTALVASIVTRGSTLENIVTRYGTRETDGAAYHKEEDETSRGVSDAEWIRRFWFVPNNLDNCRELFGGNGSLPGIVSQGLEEHNKFAKGITYQIEGYTAKFPLAYRAYLEIASHKSIKTICETGFNAGHSSLGWLLSNADAHVYSFDLGRHEYSRPIAAQLQKQFPGRLDVTWGDSTKTLPRFRGENPEVKCDLIIIDGGHTPEICQADFDNFRAMATGDNLLILDNYPQLAGNYRLGEVWEPAKRTLKLAEIMRCMYGDDKKFGFTVGRYLLP